MTINVSNVFFAVLSLFLIMLIGVAARLFGVLDWQATKKLASFVVNVTQPFMILVSFQTEYTADKLKIGFAIVAASAVMHIALSFLARLIFRGSEKADRAVFEFGLIFANCGFIGYPVLAAMFGDVGYFYGAFFTLFFNVYIRIYGVFLLSRGKKDGHPVRKALLNPGTIASAIGIILFVFKISLPSFLITPFKLIGDTTFPLSMIVVGSLLCNQPFRNLFRIKIYSFSLAKLIVIPVLTLTVCVLAHVLFGFDKGLTYICVAMASMPAGANTAIFSELYKANSPLAASCVSVTSLLSVLTVPAMLWLTNIVFGLLA